MMVVMMRVMMSIRMMKMTYWLGVWPEPKIRSKSKSMNSRIMLLVERQGQQLIQQRNTRFTNAYFSSRHHFEHMFSNWGHRKQVFNPCRPPFGLCKSSTRNLCDHLWSQVIESVCICSWRACACACVCVCAHGDLHVHLASLAISVQFIAFQTLAQSGGTKFLSICEHLLSRLIPSLQSLWHYLSVMSCNNIASQVVAKFVNVSTGDVSKAMTDSLSVCTD